MKNIIKKSLSSLFLIILITSLTACFSGGEKSKKNTNTDTAISTNDLSQGATAFTNGTSGITIDNGSDNTNQLHVYVKFKNSSASVRNEYDYFSDCSLVPLGGSGEYIFTNYTDGNGVIINGILEYYHVFSGSLTNYSQVFSGSLTYSGAVDYIVTYNFVVTYIGTSATYTGYWEINDHYYSYNSNGTINTTPGSTTPNVTIPQQVIAGGCTSKPWSALGTGIGMNIDEVHALAVDSSGNLYAGGKFTTAGGTTANYVAKWDGTSWSALGTGTNNSVDALAFDASGNLYAGGKFTTTGGTTTNYVAKWNGTSWSALGSGINSYVNALVFDASGNLYAGGLFSQTGGSIANRVAKWDGTSWSALGTGTSDSVNALAVDASGNLYVGGNFTTAGGTTVNHIAKWNGTSWSALGAGMNNYVYSLAVDSSGNLYAGGDFTTAGGTTMNYVTKWDGTSWSALGTGLSCTTGSSCTVYSLAVDPSGNLYAGGYFRKADGTTVNNIAKWDRTSWSALGLGMNFSVYTLAFDPSGILYAGGAFTNSSWVTVNRVAKWKF